MRNKGFTLIEALLWTGLMASYVWAVVIPFMIELRQTTEEQDKLRLHWRGR